MNQIWWSVTLYHHLVTTDSQELTLVGGVHWSCTSVVGQRKDYSDLSVSDSACKQLSPKQTHTDTHSPSQRTESPGLCAKYSMVLRCRLIWWCWEDVFVSAWPWHSIICILTCALSFCGRIGPIASDSALSRILSVFFQRNCFIWNSWNLSISAKHVNED